MNWSKIKWIPCTITVNLRITTILVHYTHNYWTKTMKAYIKMCLIKRLNSLHFLKFTSRKNLLNHHHGCSKDFSRTVALPDLSWVKGSWFLVQLLLEHWPGTSPGLGSMSKESRMEPVFQNRSFRCILKQNKTG